MWDNNTCSISLHLFKLLELMYTNILFDGSNNHIFFIERQIQNATMPYSNNQYPLMKNIIN